MMQASIDFSAPVSQQPLKSSNQKEHFGNDDNYTSEFAFREYYNFLLASKSSKKNLTAIEILLKSNFERYCWNGHNLNEVCSMLLNRKLLFATSVADFLNQLPTEFKPKSYLPFKALMYRYNFISIAYKQTPTDAKKRKIIKYLDILEDHGVFGNPGSVIAELNKETEFIRLFN